MDGWWRRTAEEVDEVEEVELNPCGVALGRDLGSGVLGPIAEDGRATGEGAALLEEGGGGRGGEDAAAAGRGGAGGREHGGLSASACW